MSTIRDINLLLKDFENQVTISQDQVARNAPLNNLENSLNVLMAIHRQLMDKFSNSAGARYATYTIFGDKMQMDGILTYTKNVVLHLHAIIKSNDF